MLDRLNRVNKLPVLSVTDPAFRLFGRVVEGYDFTGLVDYCDVHTAIPAEGNVYLAGVEEMEAMAVAEQLSSGFYGGMPAQIGYCNGRNTKLNAFEYHKGSEIDIAVTPLVLLLALLQDIEDGQLSTAETKAFYLPKGMAVELYGTTLHYAPCRVCDEGFKCLVVLPKGTNLPLAAVPPMRDPENRLLRVTNKWLLAHPDSPTAAKGGYVGLKGENLEIFY